MRNRLITHYLREVAAIAFMEGPWSLKKHLLASYTGLTWRYVLAAKFSLQKNEPVRLGGFSILPSDFSVLRYLYEDLFIGRDYDLPLNSAHPVIVDCGANIGLSLIFFKECYPQASIIAFEPDPENFKRLQATVEVNFPDVTIHNKAVSDTPGRMELFSTTDSKGTITKSLYRERLEETALVSESVEVVRLSDYVHMPIDLLKLDVEGAEIAVIGDLVATGAINHVRNMVVEFHDIMQEGRPSLSGFLAKLEQQGFLLRLAAEPLRSEGRVDMSVARDVLIYASRRA
jgi:FkbM family methyltransferase